MTTWIQHAIWWHVYPLGFVGAEREALPADAGPTHRLGQLQAWLGYLRELGANGLLLGPVFESETHGYDTVDHFRIDRRLGDEDDLRELVQSCRGSGIRVLLDGVFNHVGRGFAPFRDVLEHGPDSRYAGWFRLHTDGPGDDVDFDVFEGHSHLVALDHDNAEVEDHVVEVMQHWLDIGIDGWRLDAAYAVPPAFWRRVTDRVRRTHPDAWFVGEVIHGPYAPFVEDGGLDAVTQYELWKAIWSSLNDRNLHELAWTLGRHAELLDTCVPMTFVGNHDVTRIATRLDEPRHVDIAVTVLCTLPGTPSIYAGDEQAFTGTKQEHARGDDAVRPQFPDDPDGLSPLGWDTYHHHQRLISLRRRHPTIANGTVEVLDVGDEHLAYAAAGQDDRVVVLLNVGDAPHRFEQTAASEGDPAAVEASSASDDPWVVEPHGWTVLTIG